jgi:hypothetical protein
MSGVKTLTTHEAQVTTASVEVKTLTIRGKQVTLAVFRQLIEEDVIEWSSISTKGTLWGMVNYHPEPSGPSLPHLHIVWQKEDTLRRATFYLDELPDGKTGAYTFWRGVLIAHLRRSIDRRVYDAALHGAEMPDDTISWTVCGDSGNVTASKESAAVLREWSVATAPIPDAPALEDEDAKYEHAVDAETLRRQNAWQGYSEASAWTHFPERPQTPRSRNKVVRETYDRECRTRERGQRLLEPLRVRIADDQEAGFAGDRLSKLIAQAEQNMCELHLRWDMITESMQNLDQLFIAV